MANFFSLISLFDASISGFPLEENGKRECRFKKNQKGKKVIHHKKTPY